MAVVKRAELQTVAAFKTYWKQNGPFRYALTSREYPPVLLAPEEWLFSSSAVSLLKALMQWDERKMRMVPAPFNPRKQNMFRPETLAPWKIHHFPEEWSNAPGRLFTPMGHLTRKVWEDSGQDTDATAVETAFFEALVGEINTMGYVLLSPDPVQGSPDSAFLDTYLDEWAADEDSG